MSNTSSPKVREAWTGPGRYDSSISKLNPEEDALHIEPGTRTNFEWWYFDAYLESGHIVVAFFYASNPNPTATGKCGVELVLLRPDGQKTQRFISFDKSEFIASRERPEVRVGENYLRADFSGELPVYEIQLQSEELEFHLTYHSEVNGWKPGSGYSEFGEMGYFAWVVPIPRATVTGTIRDGNQEISVRGVGYHDHNWLNFSFQKIIDYWMWGRIYSENYTILYAAIQCNKKMDSHMVKVLMAARGKDVFLSTGNFEFQPAGFEYSKKAANWFPRRIAMREFEGLEIEMTVKQVLEEENMLKAFNPLLQLIVKHLLRLRPGYFRLLSDFEIRHSLASKTIREQGTTLHEIVAFKSLYD